MANTMTFEKAMVRLEEIVAKLEGGQCSLDESLKLFEEGTKLTAFCGKALRSAEQKITRLTSADAADDAETNEGSDDE